MKRAELYEGMEVYISPSADWRDGSGWQAGPGTVLDISTGWEDAPTRYGSYRPDPGWDRFHFQPTYDGKGQGVLVERVTNEYDYKAQKYIMRPRLDVVPLSQIRAPRAEAEAIIARNQELRAQHKAEMAARSATKVARHTAAVDRLNALGFVTLHAPSASDEIRFSISEVESLLEKLEAQA